MFADLAQGTGIIGTSGTQFGLATALSEDGNTLAIGAPFAGSGIGRTSGEITEGGIEGILQRSGQLIVHLIRQLKGFLYLQTGVQGLDS